MGGTTFRGKSVAPSLRPITCPAGKGFSALDSVRNVRNHRRRKKKNSHLGEQSIYCFRGRKGISNQHGRAGGSCCRPARLPQCERQANEDTPQGRGRMGAFKERRPLTVAGVKAD